MGDEILYSTCDSCVFSPLGAKRLGAASPLATALAFKNRLELLHRQHSSMKHFD